MLFSYFWGGLCPVKTYYSVFQLSHWSFSWYRHRHVLGTVCCISLPSNSDSGETDAPAWGSKSLSVVYLPFSVSHRLPLLSVQCFCVVSLIHIESHSHYQASPLWVYYVKNILLHEDLKICCGSSAVPTETCGNIYGVFFNEGLPDF